MTRILTAIRTYINNTNAVSEYVLSYKKDQESYLEQVQRCSQYSGPETINPAPAPRLCQAPTVFEWTDAVQGTWDTLNFASLPMGIGPIGRSDLARVKYADFNADGLTDVLFLPSPAQPCQIIINHGYGNWTILNGPTFPVRPSSDMKTLDASRVFPTDLNGDGAADL